MPVEFSMIELAHKAWPQHPKVMIEVLRDFDSVAVRLGLDGDFLLTIDHPKAMEALQAVLLVLAGEDK